MKKVALPVIDDELNPHFGYSHKFKLISVDKRNVVKEELIIPPFHEPELLPAWLSEKGLKEIIALEVRRRAHPHDRLVVTGFEPAIYTVSGLSCPSRFAADHFIYSSDYSHSRDRWKAEHEIALRMDPPRFVVCRFWEEDYVVRRRAVGYEQVYDQGSFLLFERPPGPGP